MVMVLTHRWDGRDEADVVSLLHPVARRGLVVREGVTVITCNGKDIYGLLFFFGPIFWSIFYAKDVKLDIMCNYSNNKIIFSWLTSSMRFVLWVDERIPFLCQNLVTKPEEDDVMLLVRNYIDLSKDIPISWQFGLFEDVLLQRWYFVQRRTPVDRGHLWIRSLHTTCLCFRFLHLQSSRWTFWTCRNIRLKTAVQRLMGYWRDWGWIKH